MQGSELRSTIERTVLIAGVLASLLFACATNQPGRTVEAGTAYVGRGSGESPLEALGAAKVAAVYLAAVDILGEEDARLNRQRIEAAIRRSDNPNAYVYNGTLEILQAGGEPLTYEIRIGVNTGALRATLRSMGLLPANGGTPLEASRAGGSAGESAETTVPPAGAPPHELRARIERDLDRMTYMVVFSETSGLNASLARQATTSAEAFLADNRIPYVDSTQVEALRKDQEMVYEQETGRSVSITQWIAQRLHADIYIVIDAATSSSPRDGRYYGSADVSLRIFETSTARGLGAANYASPQPSVSLVSDREAVGNALQSSVYRAMDDAVRQARSYLARDLEAGIGYDLLVINTPDDRLMSAFMKDIALRVGDIRLVSWTREETRFRVTLSGSASDLQDFVYASAQRFPALSAMALVTMRGRELTFDAGM